MQVKEVMTSKAKTIKDDQTVLDAAKLMKQYDFGCIPVEGGDKLVGMLTDRDITLRLVAGGKDAKSAKVKDVMSAKVLYCYETDTLEKVLEMFGQLQIHRMPVLNSAKRFVGEISVADIARAAGQNPKLHALIGKTIEQISAKKVA